MWKASHTEVKQVLQAFRDKHLPGRDYQFLGDVDPNSIEHFSEHVWEYGEGPAGAGAYID